MQKSTKKYKNYYLPLESSLILLVRCDVLMTRKNIHIYF